METKDTLLKLILIENKVKSYILRKLEANGSLNGLSLEDKILVYMYAVKVPAKPKDIIFEFHFKKSNLAASCTKLTGAGYIQKAKNLIDAREALFSLTKKGEDRVNLILGSIKLDPKNEEIKALNGALTTIADFIDR